MPSARATLIPVAGALARITADGEPGAPHPAGLDQTLVELWAKGGLALYRAGRQAKAAARQVRLAGQRPARPPVETLHVEGAGEINRLPVESISGAELGMALALLMLRAQCRMHVVLASGELGSADGGADIPVRPVANLADCLRTVAHHFNQPGAGPAPRLFLIPRHDPDDPAVGGGYRSQLAELRTLGIEVREIRTLAEAARLVGARRWPTRPARRLLQALSGATALIALALLTLDLSASAPIPLSFGAIASADGTISVTPARRPDAIAPEMLPPCHIPGSQTPAFVIGEHMAIRLRTGTAHDLAARLLGYQHALVSVSSTGGTRVLAPPTLSPVDAHAATASIEVRAPAEVRLLVWLVKRGAPFDRAALADKLRRALAPLLPAERMSAARNLLRASAPGVLFYTYQTVSPDACGETLPFNPVPPRPG